MFSFHLSINFLFVFLSCFFLVYFSIIQSITLRLYINALSLITIELRSREIMLVFYKHISTQYSVFLFKFVYTRCKLEGKRNKESTTNRIHVEYAVASHLNTVTASATECTSTFKCFGLLSYPSFGCRFHILRLKETTVI